MKKETIAHGSAIKPGALEQKFVYQIRSGDKWFQPTARGHQTADQFWNSLTEMEQKRAKFEVGSRHIYSVSHF